MSETRTHSRHDYESRLDFAAGSDEVADTYARFNLVFDQAKAGDFVVKSGAKDPSRYLVTDFDKKTESITKALESHGIGHLQVMRIEEGYCVYEVPSNAKPLLGESLNPERESDETYISDVELFSKVGELWGNVYRATRCLPDGTVLAHTGMKEFSNKGEQMVFPVPPYGDCADIEDSARAAGIFESSIREELEAGYPNSPVEQIVGSAGTSFRGAIEHDSGTR